MNDNCISPNKCVRLLRESVRQMDRKEGCGGGGGSVQKISLSLKRKSCHMCTCIYTHTHLSLQYSIRYLCSTIDISI